MNCAIIEYWPFHEEVIPSSIYYLNQNGYIPDVYINSNSIEHKGNIFELYQYLKFNLKITTLKQKEDWEILKNNINDSNYDFCLINSFQTAGSEWAISLNTKLICIVHNPPEFYNFKDRVFFKLAALRKEIYFLTLGPISAQSLRYFLNISNFSDIYSDYFWPIKFPENNKIINKKFDIAIVGGINYQNRDFYTAISIAKANSMNIRVVGGGKDLERLKLDIIKNNACDYFSFTTDKGERTNYSSMLDDLNSSSYILGCFKMPSRYHYHSITSSVSYSIGLKIPMIQDVVTKNTYKVPGPVYYNQIFKICSISDEMNQSLFYLSLENHNTIVFNKLINIINK